MVFCSHSLSPFTKLIPLLYFLHQNALRSSSCDNKTPSGPLHYVVDEEIDFERVLDAGPRLGVGRGVGWGGEGEFLLSYWARSIMPEANWTIAMGLMQNGA